MKSFITTIIASSLLSLGIATPVNVTERAVGGVYVCPGPNWTPTNLCMHINMDNDGCWVSPWETLGSIGPDDGFICSMYVEPSNCVDTPGNQNSGGLESPGIADLQTWNDGHTGEPTGYWFNEARSVNCVFA